MALQDIKLHTALNIWTTSHGGIPDQDTTWNRRLPNFGNLNLDDLNFQSSIVIMPTVQEIIDVYDAFMLEIAQAQTESEAIQTVENNAKAQAQNIPAWASWTESEALNWHDTNIAAKLPVASLTEANVLLTVLETENRALVRMVIALRNKIFPDLEGN